MYSLQRLRNCTYYYRDTYIFIILERQDSWTSIYPYLNILKILVQAGPTYIDSQKIHFQCFVLFVGLAISFSWCALIGFWEPHRLQKIACRPVSLPICTLVLCIIFSHYLIFLDFAIPLFISLYPFWCQVVSSYNFHVLI